MELLKGETVRQIYLKMSAEKQVMCISIFRCTSSGSSGSPLPDRPLWLRRASLLSLQLAGSHCHGFSCCRAWAPGLTGSVGCCAWARWVWPPGSPAQAQWLGGMGLAAPWRVRSSQTRDPTCVSCPGRPILYHCTTREAPASHIFLKFSF